MRCSLGTANCSEVQAISARSWSGNLANVGRRPDRAEWYRIKCLGHPTRISFQIQGGLGWLDVKLGVGAPSLSWICCVFSSFYLSSAGLKDGFSWGTPPPLSKEGILNVLADVQLF